MAKTDDDRQAYLDALSRCGTMSAAARFAHVSPPTVKRWREDPAFAEAEADAREAFADTLEEEAVRRARDGVEKAVWFKGNIVGSEHQYSDALLAKLLDGHRADRYKQRVQNELTGPNGQELTASPQDIALRITALLEEARHLKEKAE
jgi:hypothetical protein